MQDNVTIIQADHDFCDKLLECGNASGFGYDQEAMLSVVAVHRLASTAQPEVKGLVEALEREAKKAAEMAAYAVKHDFDAMGEALDNMRHRLEAALAAYHEAQP